MLRTSFSSSGKYNIICIESRRFEIHKRQTFVILNSWMAPSPFFYEKIMFIFMFECLINNSFFHSIYPILEMEYNPFLQLYDIYYKGTFG